MTQFQELPTEQTFGHGFNYAVWSANTTVTLANVNWNNDYRDIVRFASPAALDAHLDNNAGPTIVTTGVTYAAVGRPIRLQIPFERANTFNYLRAYNPAQPIAGGDTGRAYYYFVTGVNFLAPDTTELVLQLDVWQTFGYGATFGNCFIERGHVGVANQDAMADYGRKYLTVPEGIDLGGEYEIVDVWKRHIASAKGNDYKILVASTVSLTAEPGTTAEPNLESAGGSSFENLPNGASLYLFDSIGDFKDFLYLYAQKPWITQGIISVQAIPDSIDYGIQTTNTVVGSLTIKELTGDMFNQFFYALKNNWRDTLPVPARYANLDKLKVFPYTVLEMTSYSGTPLVLKPESWANPHAIVNEMPHFAPPGARLMFSPYRYNAAGAYNPAMPDLFDQYGDFNDPGEFLDVATGITNFPTFSTVNNGYALYAASNANSIAFQHASAEWSQQRALQGASAAYDNTTSAIEASKSTTVQGMSAAGQSTTLANESAGWQALQAGGNSLLNGSGIGTAKGLANAGVDYAIGVNQRNQSLGIQNNLASGVNKTQTQSGEFIRNTNQSLAEYVAKGDYQNAIAGVTAKVQDARMIQPTTSGQVGGDAFNLAVYKWGYDVKVKMMQGAAMASVGEYMLRYGYQVNRFGRMPADFMVCEKFTYWKLKETYLTAAACPETFKQALRGIFEKGVTVWKNPADIGNIDIADNAPLAGVTL